MNFFKICSRLSFGFLMGVTGLFAADPQLLQDKDVNKIMKQIFDQHVDKKEMTASILKSSFRVYIDQFDPNRTYLLESEVKPFLQLSDVDVKHYLDQYQQSEFSQYRALNGLIQKAILRSRKIRDSLESNASHLFQKSESFSSNGKEEWGDPDLKKTFAANDKELTNRIKKELVQFIASERTRFGNQYVVNRETQTIRIFERQARSHENQYLFTDENGQPMNDAEKQNAFAMNVLKSLANSLDAHTTVLNPAEAYDMRIRLEKEMQGIGVSLQPSTKGFVITQIVKDSPAAKSGLVKINDIVMEIDGTQVRNLSLNKVMEMLRGKAGSQVTLLLKRSIDQQGAAPVEKSVKVVLTREEIAVDEDRAKWSYETYEGGIIGKIKLDSFYQGDNGITSENDVRDAINKLDKQGNLRGLILDLRENSGGFLSQAVKVAGLFITNGVVVVSKYFNGEEHFYRDMDGKVSYDGPLIVLTSKATASAAEIVAQALQDYGVAIVVGDEHTYGKGTIQSQTVTENQASTFFKVTVGKYYTVSGKTPQVQGVKADIVVPSQFVHENIGEEYLDYPLKQDIIPSAFDDGLADIAPNLKPWYMRYYAPTLQHKKLLWDSMMPQLKSNSEQRMSQNSDYQTFIKGTNPRGRVINPDDLQLSEVSDIMKDMITIQMQIRGDESELRGSTAQTAGVKHERLRK